MEKTTSSVSSYRDFKLKRRKLSELLVTQDPVLKPESARSDIPDIPDCGLLIERKLTEDDDSSSGIGTSLEDAASCQVRSEGVLDGEDGIVSDCSRLSGVSISAKLGLGIEVSPTNDSNIDVSEDAAYFHDEHVASPKSEETSRGSENTYLLTNGIHSLSDQINRYRKQTSSVEDKLTSIIKESLEKNSNRFNDLLINKNHIPPSYLDDKQNTNDKLMHIKKDGSSENVDKAKSEQTTLAVKRFTEFTNQVQCEAKLDSTRPIQPLMCNTTSPPLLPRIPGQQQGTPCPRYASLLSPLMARSPITTLQPCVQSQLNTILSQQRIQHTSMAAGQTSDHRAQVREYRHSDFVDRNLIEQKKELLVTEPLSVVEHWKSLHTAINEKGNEYNIPLKM